LKIHHKISRVKFGTYSTINAIIQPITAKPIIACLARKGVFLSSSVFI
jgi:hypothetical protein